jgi:uncharacterized membrane protein
MVLFSVFLAILIIMGFVPNIGFIILPTGFAITLLHIPVLVGIMVLKPKYAVALALAFGIVSLSMAFVTPTAGNIVFQNPLFSIVPRVLFGIITVFIFLGLKKLTTLKHGKWYVLGLVTIVTWGTLYFGLNALLNNHYEVTWNALAVSLPVSIVVTIGLVVLLLVLTNKKGDNITAGPATLVIGTLVHTVVVLSFLIIFRSISGWTVLFGDLVEFIYGFIVLNGIIEVMAALVIGTPIYLVMDKLIKQRSGNDTQLNETTNKDS